MNLYQVTVQFPHQDMIGNFTIQAHTEKVATSTVDAMLHNCGRIYEILKTIYLIKL